MTTIPSGARLSRMARHRVLNCAAPIVATDFIKHGRPVARVIPCPQPPAALIGSLRGQLTVRGDVHSTGLAWEADAER